MTDPRCGTTAGYRAHRVNGTGTCQPCRDAQAEWQRAYGVGGYVNRGRLMVEATGTRRRLRALVAMGWSFGHIGARLGESQPTVHRWTVRERLFASTAEKVRAVYDELSMTPGPSNRARLDARRKGWAVPLAWSDEDIDNPLARPMGLRSAREPAHMNGDPEREERVMYLTRVGLSAKEIAVRLRVGQRYVNRVRARYREEGAA